MSNLPFPPAWLRNDPAALALLPRGYDDFAARAEAVRRAAERSVHPAARAALHATAARNPSPARAESLARLDRPGVVCVVTGQQVGLFGGPAYTLYKAAAAVAAAAALEAETGQPCVPIFWLQNEDHDFVEIATCHAVDAAGALRAFTVPEDAADAERSVGARALPAAVADAVRQIGEALDGLPCAAAVRAGIEAAYRPGQRPDAAFLDLLDALFAEAGLLVLDPRAPGLAEAAAPVHRRALAEAEAIAERLQGRVRALAAAGFRAQVHVRPASPLSFFHPDGREGARHRLEPAGEGRWRLCGTDRTVSAAVVADAPPSAFGTSALLRPLVQDTLLPTAAYVGGPGELAYFAQLPELYEHFSVPMPLFVPRARFVVTDENSRRLLAKLGLSAADLHAPLDDLLLRLSRTTAAEPSPEALEASLLGPIEAALAAFAGPATALDPGLAKAVGRTRASLLGVSGRLVNRYRRTLARKDLIALDRLQRARALLAPDGAPQERVLGYASLAARHGPEALWAAIRAHTVPFEGDLKVIAL